MNRGQITRNPLTSWDEKKRFCIFSNLYYKKYKTQIISQFLFQILCKTLLFNDDPVLIKPLLHGATIADYRDKINQNLLHYSAMMGNVTLAKYSIEAGCDVNAVAQNSGDTPVITASRSARQKWKSAIIDLLIKAGANVNAAALDGLTALHALSSCFCEDSKSAQLLIDAGANVNSQVFEQRISFS